MKRRILGICLMVFLSAGMLFASGGKEAEGATGSEQTSDTTQKYKEAPMLAEMVAKGELPPVDQRLPEEPLVITPIEKIGKHGGTATVFAVTEQVWEDFQFGTGMQESLFRINKDATDIEMNIARDYELSDDFKSFTIYLREGTRWSDGAVFTADDIVFWFDDIVDMNVDWELLKGKLSDVVKLDDYTVRLDFVEPYPVVVAMMAGWESWRIFLPRHYLEKWHPKYNEDAEAMAKEKGFETWQEAIVWHYDRDPRQVNVDLPVLDAWELVETTTTTLEFQRNPYYWKVDTAGNQLPYIDRFVTTIVSPEAYTLKAISGESDFAHTNTSFTDFTLYKENESAGDYRSVLLPGGLGSDVSIALNLTYPDPVMRKLFQDLRFRRALSVSINREEINNVVFFGKATPRQTTVLPTVSYYKEEWGKANAQFDRDLANSLLDEMGLTEKDKDGFRLRPDGKALTIVVEYSDTRSAYNSILELVKEYWADIGVNAMMKYIEKNLHQQRASASGHMALSSRTARCDELGNCKQGHSNFAGNNSGVNYAFHWDAWLMTRGAMNRTNAMLQIAEDGDEKATLETRLKELEEELAKFAEEIPDGDRPPQEYIDFNDWFVERTTTALGSAEYFELSQKIYDNLAENLWIIGTVGMVPNILIAGNNLRNVETPEHTARGISKFDTTAYYFQYFLE